MNSIAQEYQESPRAWLAVSESTIAAVLFVVLAIAPLFLNAYTVYILPQYMMFGLLAMSLGFIWGFGGIVSFGQAAFFAIGGYAVGLWLNANVGGEIINPGYTGLIVCAVLGGMLAVATGIFLFGAGVRGAYFVILTLALSIIVEQIAITQSDITGGWNGLFVPRMELSAWSWSLPLDTEYRFYYFALPVMIIAYICMRMIVSSSFGKVLVSIRENEDRTDALGLNSGTYKAIAFGISGALASFAGAMYGMHAQYVAPTLGGVLFSTEVLVWVAIAGRSSLLAALFGGIVVSILSNYASAISPLYWQLALAVLFIATIVYLKGGIAGFLTEWVESARKRRGA